MRQTLLIRLFPLLLAAISIRSVAALAQEPAAPSVAEAARRARTQKENAAKPSKVITDDTLHPQAANTPATGASEAMPSNLPAPAQESSGAETSNVSRRGVSAPAGTAADSDAEKKKELEALKQEIAAKQADVDLSQRELALANDAYYSKPDFSSDRAGKAKLDSMQSDLNAKKDDLAKLKSRFAELGGVEEQKPAVQPAPMAPPRP
jgi:hypothetical protein